MRVAISSDAVMVECETEDPYSPDVMDDLCARAARLALEVIPGLTAIPTPDDE